MFRKRYLTLILSAALALSPIAVLKAASLIGLSYGSADMDGSSTSVGITANSNENQGISISGDALTVTRHDLDNFEAGAGTNLSIGLATSSPGIPNTGSIGTSATAGNLPSLVNFRAEDVATQEDLKTYSMEEIKADPNISSLSFTNNDVAIAYKDHGRFLGFIPVTLDVDVTVDQSGNITFTYPWYSFLVAKDETDLETRIRNEVSGVLTSSAGWTNYDRAVLASRILAALRAHFMLEANATSTASYNQ